MHHRSRPAADRGLRPEDKSIGSERLLRTELRHLRKDRRLNHEQAAENLDWSAGKLIRIEPCSSDRGLRSRRRRPAGVSSHAKPPPGLTSPFPAPMDGPPGRVKRCGRGAARSSAHSAGGTAIQLLAAWLASPRPTSQAATPPSRLRREQRNQAPISGAALKPTGDSKTDTINRAIQVYAYLERFAAPAARVRSELANVNYVETRVAVTSHEQVRSVVASKISPQKPVCC